MLRLHEGVCDVLHRIEKKYFSYIALSTFSLAPPHALYELFYMFYYKLPPPG